MSLDRLLSQFDALAEHGTNIAKIRKLLIINVIKRSISRDGFLQRAATAKAQIALTSQKTGGKNSKTRNQDLALPDVLLKIPAEAFGRLGDIAEIEKGLTAIQKSKPGPYPLVVTAETRSSNETFDFEGPAVVIPMVSSTGHGHASLKRIHYQEGKFAAGNILSVVKPKLPDLLNTRFLYEYLTAFKEELLVARMVGTANVSLTINGLRDIPVPLIQGEDVAKVDELMALCDRLEAQLKERDVKQAGLAKAALAKFTEEPTPENLQLLFHPSFTIGPDDLKKIVLDLAVRGKLERQDPKDEPAEELLARVRKDSHGQKHGEKLALIKAGRDELPHSIPSNWAWSCVQEIAQPNESVTYGILKPVWVETGVPTVRVTEMKSGVIDVSQLLMCETERASKFSKTSLKEGDLLISKDGTIGKTAFVPRELVGGNITQHMLRFAISTKLDRFFVRICIDAPPCQAWMIGETKGVALQGVNVGDFRRMPIPIPPLPEQRRIVAKVQHLIALTERLSSQIEASRTTGEKLLEAMVAELTAA